MARTFTAAVGVVLARIVVYPLVWPGPISLSHKAVGQNVRCLIPAYAVQSAPDLLRREWCVDVAHSDTGERVHDSIGHGHGCRHRR